MADVMFEVEQGFAHFKNGFVESKAMMKALATQTQVLCIIPIG
jgi:hypothetical protein